MKAIAVTRYRLSFQRIRVSLSVNKQLDGGVINVNIGGKLHTGHLFGRIEYAIDPVAIHILLLKGTTAPADQHEQGYVL
ncbi:hypothetical protein BH09BAC4_BH09BAC4_26850 [soil metagenome]